MTDIAATLANLAKSKTALSKEAHAALSETAAALLATENERDEMARQLNAMSHGSVSGEGLRVIPSVSPPIDTLPPAPVDPPVTPKVAYDAMVERQRCAAIVMGPIEAAYTIQEWDAMTKGDAVQNVRTKAAQLILAQPAPKVTP